MNNQAKSDIIIYKDIKLDVSLENDTLWLSQKQMEILFDKSKKTISEYIGNIFKEGELEEKSNVQNLHFAHSDKSIKYYNLNISLMKKRYWNIRAKSLIKSSLFNYS